jgi:beta-glucosidase
VSETVITELIASMTLDEKASLTAGVGLWYLPPVDRVGIPALKVSDGPSGVRGDSLIGRRSLSLPCGMTIGSTWNPELVGRLGETLAAEAVSKGVHVLLGPTICIARTPLAGRTFESFAEDPLLTARMAVAYIEGVQGQGVACCIKHFACNDQEYERMTISAEVDERTLREIHLPAFEAAVHEAGVWSVMTAYNRVNGTYCGEHPELIGRLLRDEWGFDGLVMSDWFGAHSTVPAAEAGLDLEMPGPASWFSANLAAAVRAGDVEASVLDGQVRHLLRLMDRVGILGGDPNAGQPEKEENDPARRVVTGGTVLLVNDGLLPLDRATVASVAVIGPNAGQLEAGGGSSEVTPHVRRRLADAISERLPGAVVVHEVGCRIDAELPTIDARMVRPVEPREGGPETGFTIEYFDNPDFKGDPVSSEIGHLGRLTWVGSPGPEFRVGQWSIRVRAAFTPDASGSWRLGLESAGRSVLRIDGELVVDNSSPTRGTAFYGAGSQLVEAACALDVGRTYELAVDLWPRSASSPVLGVRIAADRPPVVDEFERAVAAAAEADVAVVVVGLNRSWESEGFDRPDLSLPGRQRQLIEAVVAANPRTVVVVNAGSAVEMPWAESSGAVLMAWYPGEEGADAIADILTGVAEPSGRLPITIPHRIEDTPAFGHYPGSDGKVVYGEGVFVGYRHYESRGVEPLFAFGHGLSYTSFEWGKPEVVVAPVAGAAGAAGRVTLTVPLTNTGDRTGTEVVQVYVRPIDPRVDRPDRELGAFAKVTLDTGERADVVLELPGAAFAYWDIDAHAWLTDPGRYELLVGSSSRHIHSVTGVTLD